MMPVTADGLRLVAQLAWVIHRQTGYPVEDCRGAGMIGLMEACQRYRPASNVPFDAFARWRIRGAMLDEVRRMKPGTRAQQEQRTVPYISSLDDDQAPVVVADTDVEAEVLDAMLAARAVVELHTLRPRAAFIIRETYLRGRLLRDVGDELGITESGTAQQRKAGLGVLRERLVDWGAA